MKLRPLLADDYVLDSCGRLVPPAGHVFLDLFRVIPLQLVQPTGGEGGLPSPAVVQRVTNQSATVFYAVGLAARVRGLAVQVRWPSGRALNFQKLAIGAGLDFPCGFNNQQWCFPKPLPLAPGDAVTVEAAAGLGGTFDMQLWGYVRWLLTVADAASAAVASDCLVGYPLTGGAVVKGAAAAMLPGVAEWETDPRYKCDPVGQNLSADRVALDNQCYDGQPCSFSTPEVELLPNNGVFDIRVQVPFVGVVRLLAIRARVAWSDVWDLSVGSDIRYSVRMPDGFQVTGADLVSNAALGGYAPIFPSIPVKSGDRLSIDLSNVATGPTDGAAYVSLEFVCERGAR